ncbi:hypothetical protein [Thiohalomonas denitrificans]|uniref:hypothetical protein n=1 Tax=Thiohalomonas denitrificans TaxID=415747 RepID=UPI0026F07607|nr:hypothetical protein [Thiohalomonas denitrificans]
MERHMFISVLLGTLALIMLGIFVLPGHEPEGPGRMPWQIEPVDGTTRVFGLTLGESTLADAESVIGEEAEVSLFRSPEGLIDIEAYFDEATMGGLKSKIVLIMALSETERDAMYHRGIRIATMGSGTRKVTLAPEDQRRVRRAPIASLTYLPRIDLEPELLIQRFGEPARRIEEPEEETVHWLYPALGLDIAVHEEGREVFQYVSPDDFGRVIQPLREGAPVR